MSVPRLPDPDKPIPKPQKRQENRGWTYAVSKRNAQFLQSVDFDRMPGVPFAVTLTVPAQAMEQVTPEMMHKWIDMLIKNLRRRGLLHFHWVIEFTAQHMPHIHMTIWMCETSKRWNRHKREYETVENDLARVIIDVLSCWSRLTAKEGIKVLWSAQKVEELDGDAAWLAYVAKHSQRGVMHYQRQLSAMPEEWEKPGALWGHSRGDPTF